MEDLKDFTREEAERWVEQEIVKHTTPESIRQRLASERRMAAWDSGFDWPNSDWAHNEMIRRLEALLTVQ